MVQTAGNRGGKTADELIRPYLPVVDTGSPSELRNHAAIAEDYCDGVLSGRYPSGRLVRLAVERHQMDLELGPARGLEFDAESATQACDFFPKIRHTMGEFDGEPFLLAKWQTFIIWCLFGWKHAETGARRFKNAFISVGRGNGKTPFAAAIALYCCFAEDEPRAKGFCYATKLDQAKQLFEEALCQIDTCYLRDHTRHIRTHNSVQGPNGSEFKAMSTETTNDGTVPQVTIVDELHRFKEAHRKPLEQIETGFGKRRQPLLLKITTAGDDQSHVWAEQLEQFTRALEQVEDPPDTWHSDEQFAYVAEIDEDDDILDEANWPKSNPSLLEENPPVKVEFLRSLAEKAAAGDPAAERMMRRYHANQKTMSAHKPISPRAWKLGNVDLPPNLEEIECYGAYDVALHNDFAAISLVFPLGDGIRAGKSWAWTVEERGETLQSNEFLRVLDCDNVFIQKGDTIDLDPIKAFALELHDTHQVLGWTYDESYAHEMAKHLWEEAGIERIKTAQTARSYNEPLRSFLSAVKKGKFIHGGCPLLRWCANNLVVVPDNEDRIRPSKEKSLNKIDPIVAMVMAWRESMFGEGDGSSYYEENELEVL